MNMNPPIPVHVENALAVPNTWARNIVILTHVKTLLGVIPDSPIDRAFQRYGVVEFLDIINMSDDEIYNLDYNDPDHPGTDISIPKGSKAIIKILISMYSYWTQSLGIQSTSKK